MSSKKPEPCRNCEDVYVTCRHSKGNSKLNEGIYGDDYKYDCPYCDGTGRQKCAYCNGTGIQQ